MDTELKQHLESMETRLTERFDAMGTRIVPPLDVPAHAVDTQIADRLESRLVAFDSRMDAFENRMKDFIRQSKQGLETRIIAEFWK